MPPAGSVLSGSTQPRLYLCGNENSPFGGRNGGGVLPEIPLREGGLLEGLVPIEYLLEFSAPPDCPYLPVSEHVRIEPGQTTELVLTVRRFPGAVQGTVVDGQGAPVEGAMITLLALFTPRHGRSDEEGRFRFEGVQPGMRSLWVDPSPVRDRNLVRFETSDQILLQNAATVGLCIELEPGYAVHGSVRDAGTGVPVGSGWVGLSAPGQSGGQLRDGRFTFRNVPAGSYDLYYRASWDSPDEQYEQDVVVGPRTGDAEVELFVRTRR